METINNANPPPPLSLEDLPAHILEDICVIVSSSFLSDINSLHLVSKYLNNCSNRSGVVENVMLDVVPWSCWKSEESQQNFTAFMIRCLMNANPEALYRGDLVNYLTRGEEDKDDGRRCLFEASTKGHAKASYGCGMLLLTEEVRPNEVSMVLLSPFHTSLLPSRMESVETVRRRIWRYLFGRWGSDMERMREMKGRLIISGCSSSEETH